jgi:molybdopterin molybdotransferase
MIDYNKALQLVLKEAGEIKIITKNILDATGYSIAEDISADRDYPPFNRVMMDGYAVIADDLNSRNNRELKQIDIVYAGENKNITVTPGCCIKVMTGAPLPDGADAVVKVENTTSSKNIIRFSNVKILSGQFIARQGTDSKKGNILVVKGNICNASILKILAAVGKEKIKVFSRPRISIIITGNEIIPISEKPKPAEIRDSNSYSIRSFLHEYNINPQYLKLVDDDRAKLTRAVLKGMRSDILILSGGVSMGDHDYIPEILTDCGVRRIFHKVKIKPGKPIWFGRARDGPAVFGLPGNPLSCLVTYKMLIEPYLRRCMCMRDIIPIFLPLIQNRTKAGSRMVFFPCKISTDEDKKISGIIPIEHNGSGDIKASYGSDGLGCHPSERMKMEAGELVKFYPWKTT